MREVLSFAQVDTSHSTFSIPIVQVVNHFRTNFEQCDRPFLSVLQWHLSWASKWLRFYSRLPSKLVVVVGKTLLIHCLLFLCSSSYGKHKLFPCVCYIALLADGSKKMVANFWNWLLFRYFSELAVFLTEWIRDVLSHPLKPWITKMSWHILPRICFAWPLFQTSANCWFCFGSYVK